VKRIIVTGSSGLTHISDLRRLRADYPHWEITRSLDDIFRELTDR
jgi:hypothetical protein